MNINYLIFANSFYSALIIPLHGEYGWFSAVLFGGYNLPLVTSLATLGSLAATGVNFFLGNMLSRHERLHRDGVMYGRVAHYFRYAVILLLFPQLWLTGALTFFAGLMRVNFALTMAVALAGRLGYYGYYLMQH